MPRAAEKLAYALLGVYLITLLAVPRVPTSIAALACLVAVAAAFGRWRDDARAGFRHMSVLVVPAAAYLSHLVLQIVAGVASPDRASQLLIGLLAMAVGLSGVPGRLPDVRRWILPAAAVGAIASCVLALYQVWVLGILRPYGWLGGSAIGNGAIKFGDLATLQALLALVLVLTATDKLRRLLGLAGLFFGVMALALTQARGGILGLLLAVAALALGLALRRQADPPAASATSLPTGPAAAVMPARPLASGIIRARRSTAVALMAIAVMLSLSAAGFMQERFAAIEPQVQRYLRGDIDSEVGQRLALWHAAIVAGLREPVTGVGFGRFGQELARQDAAGESAASGKILYGQAHSEYLSAFAEAGISGFVSLLLMFIAPVVGLLRQIRAGRGSPAAYAALVIAAAFAGFALTDNMFDRQITVIAFFFLNAWFLRAAWSPGASARPPEPAGR